MLECFLVDRKVNWLINGYDTEVILMFLGKFLCFISIQVFLKEVT